MPRPFTFRLCSGAPVCVVHYSGMCYFYTACSCVVLLCLNISTSTDLSHLILRLEAIRNPWISFGGRFTRSAVRSRSLRMYTAQMYGFLFCSCCRKNGWKLPWFYSLTKLKTATTAIRVTKISSIEILLMKVF